MDVGVRAKHDCMDAGGRATPGVVAEDARAEGRRADNSFSVWIVLIVFYKLKPFSLWPGSSVGRAGD